MASDVEIVNIALTKLGGQPILDFDESSEAGRLATRTFAEYRDQLLRECPWNFALKRAEIAAEATAPVFGWARAFPFPSDYIRLKQVGDPPTKYGWKIEGGRILSDLPTPLPIVYVRQVLEADSMDPSFREALAAKLAMEWAEAITGTKSKTEEMTALYRLKLSTAMALDGQEDDQQTLDQYPSFITSRF